MSVTKNRRTFLKGTAGAVGAGTIAGCTRLEGWLDLDVTQADDKGYAAFFALWDWAETIGGEHFSFENPVDVGEMGHGWEPPSGLATDIAQTAMFIYLDTPEFSWAQNFAGELSRDHPEVMLVDAMQPVEPYLIYLDQEEMPDADHDVSFDPDDIQVGGERYLFDLRRPTSGLYYHNNDHWHGILSVQVGEEVPLRMIFEDNVGNVLPVGEQGFELKARIAESEDPEPVTLSNAGDRVLLNAETTGQTRIIIELHHESAGLVFASDEDPLIVDIVEEGQDIDDNHDPHVWVDPVISQEIVDVISEALQEADPDNADAYEQNAEEYKDELQEIHEEFETLTEEAEIDTAIFAGHDSYQYVENRYDFELKTLVGVSPDEEETIEEVEDLRDTAQEYDIDTVLFDPFEAADPNEDLPQAAQVLMDEVDSIEHAEPLTPLEGNTSEWQDNGWGWVDQMREINLPSLRQALKAE